MGILDDLVAEDQASDDTRSSIREGYGGLLIDLDRRYSIRAAMSLADLLVYQNLLEFWIQGDSATDDQTAPKTDSRPSMVMRILRSMVKRFLRMVKFSRRSKKDGSGIERGSIGDGSSKAKQEEAAPNSAPLNEYSSAAACFGDLFESINARKKIRDKRLAERKRLAELARIAKRGSGWGL